nr:Chain B, Cell adhesion molecule 1 [synthetic construct]
ARHKGTYFTHEA